MGELVRPTQFGFGTPGGVEAVVYATHAYLSEEKETQVLIKLDFKNAVNTVYREKLLRLTCHNITVLSHKCTDVLSICHVVISRCRRSPACNKATSWDSSCSALLRGS